MAGFPGWIIGVILMLSGTFMNNLGNNLMSLGHCEIRDLEKLKSKCNATPLVSEKSTISLREMESKGNWLLTGTIIFVIGALVTFLSFGFAPQSLLAALESAQFLSNVVFMKYIHGIAISRKVMWATSAIVVGNILVVIFSSKITDRYNTREIVHLYAHNTGYHIFVGVTMILFFLAYFVCKKYSKAREAGDRLYNHDVVEPVSFIIYSSLIGSQAVLHSKNLSMIVFECLSGNNQFDTPHAYIIYVEIVVWAGAAIVYVNRMNRGLDLYPPGFFIPVLAVSYALFTIVSGGLYFYEFAKYTVPQYICFSLGVVMICGGVAGLSSGPQCRMTTFATKECAVHPECCVDEKGFDEMVCDVELDEKVEGEDKVKEPVEPKAKRSSLMMSSPRCHSSDPEAIVSMVGIIAPKRRRSRDNSYYEFALEQMKLVDEKQKMMQSLSAASRSRPTSAVRPSSAAQSKPVVSRPSSALIFGAKIVPSLELTDLEAQSHLFHHGIDMTHPTDKDSEDSGSEKSGASTQRQDSQSENKYSYKVAESKMDGV